MTINWLLVGTLFILALPGTIISIPRLVRYLLSKQPQQIQSRMSKLVIGQILLLVFIACIAGSLVSKPTGLEGVTTPSVLQDNLFYLFLYTVGGLLIFLLLFYGLISRLLDDNTLTKLNQIRASLALDGCVLYGVVEEILARWGLMSLLSFFFIAFTGQRHLLIYGGAILTSSIMYAFSQLPLYLAIGVPKTRAFIYSVLLLYSWQGLLFGFIFWHYGILATTISHMLFHIGWWIYDNPKH